MTARKVPVWGHLLALIPALTLLFGVILLLPYKPDGYKVYVGTVGFAVGLMALIMVFTVRRSRKGKLRNG